MPFLNHNGTDKISTCLVDIDQVTDGQDAVTEPEETKTELKHLIDFTVFQKIDCDDHCGGKNGYCKAVERIIAALDYHQFLVNGGLDAKYGDDPKSVFIAFCEDLYAKSAVLNDYIHFVNHHADDEGLGYIRGRLHFQCDSVVKCGATSRHYRDRREDSHSGTNDSDASNWFIERIDSIHFMVHHLHELGLRVSMEKIQSELMIDDETEDKSILVDLGMKRMAKEIDTKRSFMSTTRLDGGENSKFTMTVEMQIDGIFCRYIFIQNRACTLCIIKRVFVVPNSKWKRHSKRRGVVAVLEAVAK